jgi:hypothetical protein
MSMGEQRPALPVFPAAMSTLTQPTTGPPRWHAPRITAAVLCFAAFALVVVGLFLPLHSAELSFAGESVEVTVTAWSADMADIADTAEVPKVGYPLVFAAIILACAAALCWYAATPAAPPGAGRVAGVTTLTGGAFLIGTVWTVALLVVNSVDSILLLGSLGGGFDTEATYLVGYWLLLTAAALGLVATALSLVPARRPTWQQPPPPDPNLPTPPYGIVLPVEPPPQYQVDPLTGHALQVDPLTGQPFTPGPPSPASGRHYPPTLAPGEPFPLGPPSPASGQYYPPSPAADQHYPPGPPRSASSQSFAAGQPTPSGQPTYPSGGEPAVVDQPAAPPAHRPVADALAPSSGHAAGTGPDGLPPDPVANGAVVAPVGVPDAPPAPESRPGPAVPPVEDPRTGKET